MVSRTAALSPVNIHQTLSQQLSLICHTGQHLCHNSDAMWCWWNCSTVFMLLCGERWRMKLHLSSDNWRAICSTSDELMNTSDLYHRPARHVCDYSAAYKTSDLLTYLQWQVLQLEDQFASVTFRHRHPPKLMLVADSDPRVCQHSSYHPPVDPLSTTERSPWLLHVHGIHCHPVFGLRRRWHPSVYI